MRTTIVMLAVLFAGSAHAEISRSKPKTLPAGADVCQEIAGGGGKCAAGAKLKSKSLGKARVYRVDGEQQKVTFAIDTGKETWKRSTFIACGRKSSGSWSCITATYGGPTIPCTAALQRTGEVKYTCTASDPLSL